MRILFTICGRAGSKGIRNKNLRTFCGKKLAYFTTSVIDLYLTRHPECEYDIVVNSDSPELIDIVTGNGQRAVEVVPREERLAGDVVGKIEVIADCLAKMRERTNAAYDMVVDLDITSPLRTVADLENVIALQSEKHADVTTTVAHARRNPYFNQLKRTAEGISKVIPSNYTARQQAPAIYDMNASIYAYDPAYLGTGKGVLDGHLEIVEMFDTGILDLDNEEDFGLMEVITAHLVKTMPAFREVYEHIPG